MIKNKSPSPHNNYHIMIFFFLLFITKAVIKKFTTNCISLLLLFINFICLLSIHIHHFNCIIYNITIYKIK